MHTKAHEGNPVLPFMVSFHDFWNTSSSCRCKHDFEDAQCPSLFSFMHETQQPSTSIFCLFNEIKVSFDLFAVLLSDESGVTESHQYEVDESEVWRHHQLQR